MFNCKIKTLLLSYVSLFIQQGNSVNRVHNVQEFMRLHEAVHREKSELWPNLFI